MQSPDLLCSVIAVYYTFGRPVSLFSNALFFFHVRPARLWGIISVGPPPPPAVPLLLNTGMNRRFFVWTSCHYNPPIFVYIVFISYHKLYQYGGRVSFCCIFRTPVPPEVKGWQCIWECTSGVGKTFHNSLKWCVHVSEFTIVFIMIPGTCRDSRIRRHTCLTSAGMHTGRLVTKLSMRTLRNIQKLHFITLNMHIVKRRFELPLGVRGPLLDPSATFGLNVPQHHCRPSLQFGGVAWATSPSPPCR
jgi:hypothetical protein